MKANLLIALALSSTAQAKLQTIQTYTPPAGVDAGCGNKVCSIHKKGVAK